MVCGREWVEGGGGCGGVWGFGCVEGLVYVCECGFVGVLMCVCVCVCVCVCCVCESLCVCVLSVCGCVWVSVC